jgi:hypothetical protein
MNKVGEVGHCPKRICTNTGEAFSRQSLSKPKIMAQLLRHHNRQLFTGNLIPILFNDEPYLTPPNLPLVLALAARSAGGAAGGGVNSMQHQIKSVLLRKIS